MKQSFLVTLLFCCGAAIWPVPAHSCVGDCNGDNVVAINELITGVAIALGEASAAACLPIDVNGDGRVMINELVAAVDRALNGCGGPTVTVTGSCAWPGHGSHGLTACDAGTPLSVFRCDDRAHCLGGQPLAKVAETTVATGGSWTVQVPLADAAATLVFQAEVAHAVIYRTLGFGVVGGGLHAALVRGVAATASVDITPITEAAVELLDANGFENYGNAGAQEVLAAVEQADSELSFPDGIAPDMAAALALQTASDNAMVMQVLQSARNTPTPTATSTPTATRTPLRGVLFVASSNSSTVDIVNAATGVFDRQVQVGEGPRGVTLTPDGALVLVANELSDTVSIIDTATRDVRATIPDFHVDVPDAPYFIAVGPSGHRAYVTNNLSSSVSVLNLDEALADPSASFVTRVQVGAGPAGIVAARQHPFVYVANGSSGSLSVIDRATNEPIAVAQLPGNPVLLALTSDDATLYATLRDPAAAQLGHVVVLDTALIGVVDAQPVITTLSVGSSPTGITIAPDDQFVYVVNTGDVSLSVISRAGDRAGHVVSTVPLLPGAKPFGVALSADAGVAYVTNCMLGSVSFIDTALALSAPQSAILRTVEVGPCPQGIAALEP